MSLDAERVRITVEVDVEPTADASPFVTALFAVMSGFAEVGLYPHLLMVEDRTTEATR